LSITPADAIIEAGTETRFGFTFDYERDADLATVFGVDDFSFA